MGDPGIRNPRVFGYWVSHSVGLSRDPTRLSAGGWLGKVECYTVYSPGTDGGFFDYDAELLREESTQ